MPATRHLRIADADRREPLKLDFSKRLLETLRPPAEGRTWVYDATLPGLALMITDRDARAFYLYKKIRGRPQRIRIGGFEEITVDQARKLCARKLGDIADGADPQAEKRAVREETTLGELWTWFLAQARLRKRSFGTDEHRWKNHLSGWSSRRLSSITSADVAALHTRIGREKPATANRVLALLSTMFNRARAIGYAGGNPCAGVQRFPEESRERFLNADELARFMAAVDKQPGLFRDFFLTCLWTGQRQGNVRAMRWDELDMKAATWTIPGAKFKNGRSLTVHLSAPALAILKQREKGLPKSGEPIEWVFPQVHDRRRQITNPAKRWDRVREAAKLPDVRIHDLRRTAGSWMAATGANLSAIGKSLGHRNTATTAVYARLDLSGVKGAVDVATAAMQAAMKPKTNGRKPHSRA
jgi:integrase